MWHDVFMSVFETINETIIINPTENNSYLL